MYMFREEVIRTRSLPVAKRVASRWYPDEEGILFLVGEDGELYRVSRRVVDTTHWGDLIIKWVDED